MQVLTFCSCSSEHRFYHTQILLLNRLVYLFPWCFSLSYVLIIHLFFLFLLWLFSRFDSGEMVMSLSFQTSFSLESPHLHFLCLFFVWVCGVRVLYVSILLKCSCFSVFTVLIILFGSYYWHVSVFICWCIYNISGSENQPLFVIILVLFSKSLACYHKTTSFFPRFLSFLYTPFM